MIDTIRWASVDYQIKFERITQETPIKAPEGLTLTAWGLSKNLNLLLNNPSPEQITDIVRSYLPYIIETVVDMIALMIDESERTNSRFPPIDSLYLVVQADLVMPGYSILPVDFVTNIVRSQKPDKVIKFIALLDPSETSIYIDERTNNLDYIGNEMVQ